MLKEDVGVIEAMLKDNKDAASVGKQPTTREEALKANLMRRLGRALKQTVHRERPYTGHAA